MNKFVSLSDPIEDKGYDDAWNGFGYNNPYKLKTYEYSAYKRGYESAMDDLIEWTETPALSNPELPDYV